MRVDVTDLVMTNLGFAVFLKNATDPRTLPIFIGAPEAQSISIVLSKTQVPRPMTHDLLRTTLETLGGRLVRISVCAVQEGTFFAELTIQRDDALLKVDARPSDAIALALRCAAPICVAPEVMDAAGRVLEAEGASPAPSAAAHKPKPSPLELLKHKLEKAIADERYEDAAQLRDRIQHLESSSHGN